MRIQVNITKEMMTELDNVAKDLGVSRSALCSVWLGQSLRNYQSTANLFQQLGGRLGDELASTYAIEDFNRDLKADCDKFSL